MAKKTLRDGRPNLRGQMVVVQRDDERRRAYVVTHIRGDRWLISTARPFPGGHRVAWGEHHTIVSESEIVAIN